MPASAHVEARSVRLRPVSRAPVVRMTLGVQPGIVAATLLAHEFEQHVRQGPENTVADAENGGTALPNDETVPAGPAQGRKVELNVPREFRPRSPR